MGVHAPPDSKGKGSGTGEIRMTDGRRAGAHHNAPARCRGTSRCALLHHNAPNIGIFMTTVTGNRAGDGF